MYIYILVNKRIIELTMKNWFDWLIGEIGDRPWPHFFTRDKQDLYKYIKLVEYQPSVKI